MCDAQTDKVRDVVEAAVSEVTFRLIAEKMHKTLGIQLAGDPVETVQVLANRYDLNVGRARRSCDS